jgi:integrase
MAWLEKKPSGQYHVAFRFGPRKIKKSLRTKDKKVAEARRCRLEENLRLVESGRLTVPEDADVARFLLSDGKLKAAHSKRPPLQSLADFSEAFLRSIPDGALEHNTLDGMRIHVRHLKRLIGRSFPFREISLADLQAYLDRRSKEPGLRAGRLSPATIRKEITTLRCIWNWAREAGHVTRRLPLKGLRYPKSVEKPPFQTRAEIERRIARGGLSNREEAELWDSLFLTLPDIQCLLSDVERVARHPFVYPMFVFAAHTGARRSEMIRSRLEDIDLVACTVTIREKKRVKGKLTTRTAPLSPLLRQVMDRWIAAHPGGQHTFCLGPEIARSTKNRDEFPPLTPDETRDHFKRTLSGTQWSKLRGWHVFRHSFCSNCAARGIDQRIINAWVGHQTEEMVRRYRHLIPNQQQRAIREVFGSPITPPVPPPSSESHALEVVSLPEGSHRADVSTSIVSTFVTYAGNNPSF